MPQSRSQMPAREVALGGAHEKFKVWRDNGEEEEDSALLMATCGLKLMHGMRLISCFVP